MKLLIPVVLVAVAFGGCTENTGALGAAQAQLNSLYDGDGDAFLTTMSKFAFDTYDCQAYEQLDEETKQEIRAEFQFIGAFLREQFSREEFLEMENVTVMPGANDPAFTACPNYDPLPSDTSVAFSMSVAQDEFIQTWHALYRWEGGRWATIAWAD